jgi:two-component system OmpR family response regulator
MEPELAPPPNVLVVDDDREIRVLVSEFLSQQGLRVSTAGNGREMDAALAGGGVDLVILDLMLPDKHGLEICRDIRAKSALPVLILTAMGSETDRVVGLEVGADDYLPKPFSPRELLARVRAILRRSRGSIVAAGEPAAPRILKFAGWRLDLGHRRLTSPDGMIVDLTTGEYELLVAFAERPQRVLSRAELLEYARGRDASPFERSIDVQVSRLRRKIEDDAGPRFIVTIRGDGYMFTPEVEAA